MYANALTLLETEHSEHSHQDRLHGMLGLGRAELELGNLERAEEILRQLLFEQQTGNDQSKAKESLSKLLWRQGKLADAAALFTTDGLADEDLEKPSEFDVSFQYGDTLLGLGDYPQAAQLLTRLWEKASADLGSKHPIAGRALSRLLVLKQAKAGTKKI